MTLIAKWKRCGMRRAAYVLVCAGTLGSALPAHAVPAMASDPPMSAERIASLPPEIRGAVVARCGAHAEAGHYFATYDDNSNVIRLHYALLSCPGAADSGQGASYVQTFVRHGDKYVLSRSGHSHVGGLYPRQNSVRLN